MKRFLRKRWYILLALLTMIVLVAASPTPRRILSESFTDWIHVYGDNPLIYLDNESTSGEHYGGIQIRNYDHSTAFFVGAQGTDGNYEYFAIRGTGGMLAFYADTITGNVGIKKAPAVGVELDVNGDISGNTVLATHIAGTTVTAESLASGTLDVQNDADISGNLVVGGDLAGVGSMLNMAGDADISGNLVVAETVDIGAAGAHGHSLGIDGGFYARDDSRILGVLEAYTIKSSVIAPDSDPYHPYVAITGNEGGYPFVVENWDGVDNKDEAVVYQEMMIDAYSWGDNFPEDPDIVFTDNTDETWRIGVNRSDDAFVITPYGEGGGTYGQDFTERFAFVVEEDYVEIGDRAQANDDGAIAAANGYFASDGDAQGEGYVMRRAVTLSNASWHDLYLDGSSDVLNVPTDSGWTFEALVTITTSGCGKSASYKVIGFIENDGGTTTLHYSTVTTLYEDDNSWDVQVVGNDTDDSLEIEVQDAGSGGDAIRAVAVLDIAEVTYP